MSENGVRDKNDKGADQRSVRSRDHSSDTLRTRRSHRSHSRERKPRDSDDRSRKSRDHSRERSHRDRDKEHDKDRERRHRERSDRDREDRDGRRRKRDDEFDDQSSDRSKRKRSDGIDDGLPPRDSPRRGSDRGPSRERDRYGDRPARPPRDPRDEFEDRPRYRGGRDDRRPSYDDRRGPPRRSPPPPPVKRPSPAYEAPPDEPAPDEPREEDSEARSVFVSQLAARLTARDLGYFFEDKLGENTVLDARIVTDRLSRRSKGIGYVEFRTIELVDKAIALTNTVVMGLPIKVQLTEAERNKTHAGDGNLNLPPGVHSTHGAMQLYVGSLHFNLTESDIKQVFEPFGELEFVDLHRDPMTGRSKGYAFVQYKRSEDAAMALEQMEGFELAGRTLRVNTVHEKGAVRYTGQQDSLDEAGGGNLNAASRQALMQKLARVETPSMPEPVMRPNIQAMESRCVLLRNMFDPEEESERDWDKDLADDVKSEVEEKYGKVERIKVDRESQGEIYIKFDSVDAARQAIQGLNGRYFGGRSVAAAFISDALLMAHT